MFEATSANFQQLVLESKVPVLVDIYADWCGPCKQLGPMLESAAMKSGNLTLPYLAFTRVVMRDDWRYSG